MNGLFHCIFYLKRVYIVMKKRPTEGHNQRVNPAAGVSQHIQHSRSRQQTTTTTKQPRPTVAVTKQPQKNQKKRGELAALAKLQHLRVNSWKGEDRTKSGSYRKLRGHSILTRKGHQLFHTEQEIPRCTGFLCSDGRYFTLLGRQGQSVGVVRCKTGLLENQSAVIEFPAGNKIALVEKQMGHEWHVLRSSTNSVMYRVKSVAHGSGTAQYVITDPSRENVGLVDQVIEQTDMNKLIKDIKEHHRRNSTIMDVSFFGNLDAQDKAILIGAILKIDIDVHESERHVPKSLE